MSDKNKIIRKNKERRLHNSSCKSILKKLIKNTIKSIKEKNIILSKKIYKEFQSKIDKYSTKKIIHKKKASRYKQRLKAKIKLINNIK